jgi:hypothetical protein
MVMTLTDDQIIAEFGDAEAAILTWKHTRRRIGDELQLLSKTGKPATGRLPTSLTGERKPTPVLAVSISNTRGFAHKFLVGG